MADFTDYDAYTVLDLRSLLADRGLLQGGTKAELVARLEADDAVAVTAQGGSTMNDQTTPEEEAPDATAEATEAGEEAAAEAQRAAEARQLPAEAAEAQMTYAEYDAIGKGENYEPSEETQALLDAKDKAVEEAKNPAEPAPTL